MSALSRDRRERFNRRDNQNAAPKQYIDVRVRK